MTTKREKVDKAKSSVQKEKTLKRVSKTWLAALANKGTGKIMDMNAVLK